MKRHDLVTPDGQNIDVDALLKNAVKESVKSKLPAPMNESYVAEQKPFKQVSEFVSQKTKDSHIALYKAYVETTNLVSSKIDTADRSESNSRHSDVRTLKLDETYNLNAMWLHELYFANCFDPNSEIVMDSIAYIKLQRDFGTFDNWQKDFIATGLAAGNGWVVCGYHTFLRKYITTIVSDHSSDVMIGFYPVIAIDLHEHAYYRDYLSDKKSYLVSQMRELNWAIIEERFKKAEGIAVAVKV